MQASHRQFQELFLDNHRNLDFRGGDHLDIDALLGQRGKHLAGNTGVGAHANPHYRYLGDFVVAAHFTGTSVPRPPARSTFLGARQVIAATVKVKSPWFVVADVLHDHVHFNIGFTDRAQNLVGHTGSIRTPR